MLTTEQYSGVFKLISAASTNATIFRAAPTWVGRFIMWNNAATMRFVKLYDLAVAPTVGTSVPLITLGVPAGSAVSIGGWIEGLVSHKFVNGFALAITANAPDADATVVAANDVGVNFFVR